MYQRITYCFEWDYAEEWARDIEPVLALSKRLDLSPGPGGSRIVPIPESERDAWAGCLGQWKNSKAAFVALYPSSQIVAHCDPAIRGTRYHVPLVTNHGCWSFSGGVWQQLEVGKVYQMDPTEIHGAVNWGTEVRLHLIVDVA